MRTRFYRIGETRHSSPASDEQLSWQPRPKAFPLSRDPTVSRRGGPHAQTSGRRQPPPRRAVRRRWVRRIGKRRVRTMRAQRAAATGTAPRQRRPCPALLPTSRREQRPRRWRRASSPRRRPQRRLASPDTEAVVVASASAAAAAAVTAPTAAAGGLAHTPGPATPSNGGASAGRPPRSVAPSPRRPAADAARSGDVGGAAQRG